MGGGDCWDEGPDRESFSRINDVGRSHNLLLSEIAKRIVPTSIRFSSEDL